VVAASVVVAAPAVGADSEWRVVSGDVRVRCPMTVGGTFEARTNAIEGAVTLADPGPALAGELVVDLRTLHTGIGLRDEHMQSNYLEVGRGIGFDHAVLSEVHLGTGDPRTVEGRVSFSGSLLLHGTKRSVSGQATVHRDGPSVHVEAHFPIRVVDFGIARPRYLGVGVQDPVTVLVSLVARPETGARASR